MTSPRSLALAGAVLATAGLIGPTASAATWRAPQFPTTSGSASPNVFNSPMGLAQSASGQATLLYRASNGSIQGLTRTSASRAFGNARQWLSASAAGTTTMLEAAWSSGQVWGLWSTRGGTRVASSANAFSAQVGGKVRVSGPLPNPAGQPNMPQMGVVANGTRANYALFAGGQVFAGTINRPSPPAITAGTPAAPVPGGGTIASSVGIGAAPSGWIAAATTSPMTPGITVSSKQGNGPWSAGTALSPNPTRQSDGGEAVLGTFRSPIDTGVDAGGNAVIAYVAYVDSNGNLTSTFAPGNNVAVVTSVRQGPTGAFSAPSILQVMPRPTASGLGLPLFNVRPVAGVAVSAMGGYAVVSFVTWADSAGDGPPTLWTTAGPIGQPFPAPTAQVDPLGDQQASYDLSGLQASINAQGQAAVAFGIELTQGQTDGLWATVLPAAGAAWSPLTEVSRCARRPQGASGGFGDWQLAPFNAGFTIAFQCVPSAPARSAVPNVVGIATYR